MRSDAFLCQSVVDSTPARPLDGMRVGVAGLPSKRLDDHVDRQQGVLRARHFGGGEAQRRRVRLLSTTRHLGGFDLLDGDFDYVDWIWRHQPDDAQ